MGMCKGCNVVFSSIYMKNGYCEECSEQLKNNTQIIECNKCKTINKITSKYCKNCGVSIDFDYLIKSICIETLNGVATKIFDKGTIIPCKKMQVFSTAEDNQSAITIHINQGENIQSKDNISLAIFELSEIRQALKGVPQIEITVEVTKEGYLNVSARDLETGKENKITTRSLDGKKLDNISVNQNINIKNVNPEKNDDMIKEIINNKILDANSKFTYKEENKNSNADELLKWAELLEKGLIDKEDFEKKKKELI